VAEPPTSGGMIVCISANPALDRRLRVPTLTLGETNRAVSTQVFPGGKAAHVAIAAHALGMRAAWIAFLGGAIGEQCASELKLLGVEVIPVRTRVPTRVNLEVVEGSGAITELLEPGGTPELTECKEMVRVCERIFREHREHTSVVISGSLPTGVPAAFYGLLIECAQAAGSKVFLDTSGEALSANLAARPDFVKPNRTEAEALLGIPIRSFHDAQDAAAKLIARGCHSAAVTLGSEGLVWLESAQGPAWIACPPRLEAISTVGCGDVTLAGFAYAAQQGWHGEEAVRFAAACGAANCLAQWESRISFKDVESLIPGIKVIRSPC
jgi:1-phosphofructokinase family hexose kinase